MSAIYLVPQLISDINKVIDHVTFLHIGSTVHWHTQDDKTDFATENTWILATISMKFKQSINVLLIKISKPCVESI